MNLLMLRIGRAMGLLFLVATAMETSGCKAQEARSTGFTGSPELMTRKADHPFQKSYWNKKYDQKAYTEVVVAPVNTDYVMAQNVWEAASSANISREKIQQDVRTLADYTQKSFIVAISGDPNRRFKVVQKAGPKTLILELALVQVVPSKPALNAMGYVSWIPTAVTLAGSTVTGSEDIGKGVVAIEGRIRDGASGEIIAMFADREHPPIALVDVKALTWWEPAKAIVDTWAQQLVALANRPPGGVVKDASSFELLVW